MEPNYTQGRKRQREVTGRANERASQEYHEFSPVKMWNVEVLGPLLLVIWLVVSLELPSSIMIFNLFAAAFSACSNVEGLV